jgi:hypothetical protein
MFFVVFFVFCFVFGEAWAEGGGNEKKVDFSGYFQNFFIFKTDSDLINLPLFMNHGDKLPGFLEHTLNQRYLSS